MHTGARPNGKFDRELDQRGDLESTSRLAAVRRIAQQFQGSFRGTDGSLHRS
jgi:hypothetical protein